MKRFLAVLLAVAMIFTLATAAMAADIQAVGYTDVTQDAPHAEAIYKLSALGLLSGYPDGSYQADETITRAEFAKLACYLFDVADAYARYGHLKSAFLDVSEGNWAEGYINCAYDNGLMLGVGYNRFAPNALVSMREVVTVALRAVGYLDFPGVWPNNYIMKAAEVGLAKLNPYTALAPATRGQVADVFAAALSFALVEKSAAPGDPMADSDGYAYVDDPLDDFNDDGCVSLLERCFGVLSETVVFYDAPNAFSEACAWCYDDFRDGEISFRCWEDVSDSFTAEPVNIAAAGYYWLAFGDLTDLGGQTAEIFINDDDEVIYIGLESSVVRYSAVSAGDAWGDLAAGDYGEIWYDGDGEQYFAKNFARFINCTDYLVFSSLDSDWLKLYYPDASNTVWNSLSFDTDDLKNEIADAMDYLLGFGTDGYVIYKDGAWIAPADLVRGDVLYAMPLQGDDDIALLYVMAKQTGELSKQTVDPAQTESCLTIDGDKYYAQFAAYPGLSGGGTSFRDAFDVQAYSASDLLGNEYFAEEVYFAPAYFFKDFLYIGYDDDGGDDGGSDGHGIISGVSSSTSGYHNYVSGLTFLTPDGAEIDIPVDRCNEAVDLAAALTDANPLIGALIEYKLNDDGEIYGSSGALSFNLRRLANGGSTAYAYDDALAATANDSYASLPLGRSTNDLISVQVDQDDNILRWTQAAADGGYSMWYDLNAATEIITVAWDDDDELIVESMTTQELLAHDFTCRNLSLFYTKDTLIKTLYIYNYN